MHWFWTAAPQEKSGGGLQHDAATGAPVGPKEDNMGTPTSVYDLCSARSRISAIAIPAPTVSPVRLFFGLTAASLLLLGTMRLHAQQQDWPPDDDYAPQQAPPPQQSYAPQQAYGYAPQNQNGYQNDPQQGYAQQNGYGALQQGGYAQQPLSPDQLTQLVAPIALYPDALVAQILAASTYPAQVSAADQWLRSMGNAPAEQIAAGADAQGSWDPSVKALTAFPQVLGMLDQNLRWTTALGNAYYNQPQDVMQTIQVMRDRAEQAGNLQSTPQEQVYDNGGAIDIAPQDPQMVYVPSYDPWSAYGAPVSPYPGFSLFGAIGSFIGSGFMHYGPGVALSAFWGLPWGWAGWGLDWLAHAVLFDHDDYWTHSGSVRDWGFPHGGPRWHGGGWDRGYDRGYDHGSRVFAGGGNGGIRPRGGSVQRWGDARTAEGFNRGYPSREQNGREQAYSRGSESFTNRPQAYVPRPQNYGNAYGRPGYGSGFGSEPRSTYQPRIGGGMTYANPGYRAPQNGYRPGNTYQNAYRGATEPRSYGGYSDHFGGQQRSGGFHLFGGGHNSEQPKAYSYGGGHSGWGGGSSYKAPKESHSFGGGHSSGGHWGGGGHSSGGGHGHSDHHR